MDPHKLRDLVSRADQDRLESYIKMYDRILLYTLAANIMPKEALLETVDLWGKVIKKTIDADSERRTEFLEATPQGRLAKLRKESDGEELRLHCLKTWKIAHDVIIANIDRHDDDDDVHGGDDDDDEGCEFNS